MEEKDLKKLLVSKIIAFESGTTNSQYPEQDNRHWQSISSKTPLRFNISLREILSNKGLPE